jgi:nucleoside-diphosphate-sugar epimerase
MNKILVCGGTVFIGKNVVLSFYKKKKYKIYSTYFKSRPLKIKDVNWIKADLRNFKDCLKVTKNIDIVIQCAATTSGSKDIINQPYLHVTDNAVMNSYLLRACYQNKIKHFIFLSCTVMYKNSKKALSEDQVEENKIYSNYYGVANTKLYVEKISKFSIFPKSLILFVIIIKSLAIAIPAIRISISSTGVPLFRKLA